MLNYLHNRTISVGSVCTVTKLCVNDAMIKLNASSICFHINEYESIGMNSVHKSIL